jgi:hypothetical protein
MKSSLTKRFLGLGVCVIALCGVASVAQAATVDITMEVEGGVTALNVGDSAVIHVYGAVSDNTWTTTSPPTGTNVTRKPGVYNFTMKADAGVGMEIPLATDAAFDPAKPAVYANNQDWGVYDPAFVGVYSQGDYVGGSHRVVADFNVSQDTYNPAVKALPTRFMIGNSDQGNPAVNLFDITVTATAAGTSTFNILTGGGSMPYQVLFWDSVNGRWDLKNAETVNLPTGIEFTISGGSTMGPAALTVVPAGGARTVGQTIVASNTAVAGSDSGKVTAFSVTQGANGIFSVTGDLALNAEIAPQGSRTGTVGFDETGLLKGAVSTGAFNMTLGTVNGVAGATGTGPYSYTLTATAQSGLATLGTALTAKVTGSMAGLASYVLGGAGAVGTTATILGGTTGTTEQTVSMLWRARTADEASVLGGVPGLPWARGLLSDVVDVTGMAPGTVYVLEMRYDPSLIQLIYAGDKEQRLFDMGRLFLGWLDDKGTPGAADDVWVNAGTGSGLQSAWTGSLVVGTWGVDMATNKAWAVTDHNSQFSVVPEPGTMALLALGGLVAVWRRKRAE